VTVAVVGAGAIGGYMAVRLAEAGHDVSVIARGPHLAAIRANGLTLIEAREEETGSGAVETRTRVPCDAGGRDLKASPPSLNQSV
jgi:2-dehydropantoate 2-reductase